ncbi:mitochondria-eating protein isoform X2 [Oenanthe melanoleuca]|uniref:mitochondria-eating protein isoform X2 n=1 Tax=Oenanthe melanoleuca TaxID=2939378 RepID=UPI0024C1023E|nr:mitochondria-eating protein isoform X2 [Oenanthe melanoleuca]
MARDLRSLVGSKSVRELQEKLEKWQRDYETNSSGENMDRCFEILDLNNEIQKQLYSILSETSQKGNRPTKSLHLSSVGDVSGRVNRPPDSTGRELQLRDLTCNPTHCRLQQLEDKLTSTQIEINEIERDLRASRLGGCNNLKKFHHMCDCDHRLRHLRDEMALLDAQKAALQRRLSGRCSPPCCVPKPCVPKPCIPKPCISKPCAPKPCISKPCISKPCISDHCVSDHCASDHCASDHCDSDHCDSDHCDSDHCASDHCASDHCHPDHCHPDHCRPDHCHPDHCHPDHCHPDHCHPDHCHPDHCVPKPCIPKPCISNHCVPKPCVSVKTWSPCQTRRACASRRACLIARFNFIYAKERLDAEAILRPYVCNMEVVQRIIYIAAVESFHAAKMAFWKVKVSVKETLAVHPCDIVTSLEVAALDYIACHKDLYDIRACIDEVISSMNIHPKLPCPAEVDYLVISSLIREICSLAFSMQTLIPALDIAVGVDGELFNKCMYYRSFDSDFSAPLVAYHVWPALLERDVVIVKGEVVTRRVGPCARRCRIRSRSCSCGRRLLPGQVTRSRSLSTPRAKRR